MMIHEITPKAGKYKSRKRVGRGPGSGLGKTAGRGHKGAGSRSGFSSSPGREGGQMPFFRRIPKRGFSNARFKKEFAVVNLGAIDSRFEDGAEISPAALAQAGLVRNTQLPVKILGSGETSKKFTVTADAFSKSAQEKITQAGGSVNVAQ
ncbi:MAG: 50S ribosomal protein L15 [Phycisphaeraceae bacterium]